MNFIKRLQTKWWARFKEMSRAHHMEGLHQDADVAWCDLCTARQGVAQGYVLALHEAVCIDCHEEMDPNCSERLRIKKKAWSLLYD